MCHERNVAMQTIKGIAVGEWGDRDHTTRTWYEALTDQDDIDLAVHWVLAHAHVFLNTSSDLDLMAKTLDAAERFQSAPPDSAMQALAERAAMTPLFS
jgi:hypothetical protein